MGYFAYAQYDVRSPIGTPCHFPYFSLHVILNEVKDPTEEPTRRILYSLWSWDISLTLNMTYFFLFVIARERSDEAISREGGFPQGIHYFTLVVRYFACSQYDVKFRGKKNFSKFIKIGGKTLAIERNLCYTMRS